MLESSSNTSTTTTITSINHSNVKRNNKENQVCVFLKKLLLSNLDNLKKNINIFLNLFLTNFQTISDAMIIQPNLNSLSNQQNNNNLVNSVIQQTNQQSVIQSAGGATVQTVQVA